MIQLAGIERTYVVGSRPVHALRNATLDIHPGEYVSIMGLLGGQIDLAAPPGLPGSAHCRFLPVWD